MSNRNENYWNFDNRVRCMQNNWVRSNKLLSSPPLSEISVKLPSMHQIPHASSRKDRDVESYDPCTTTDTLMHIKDGHTTSARKSWIRRHTSCLVIVTSTPSALKRKNEDPYNMILQLHVKWTQRLKMEWESLAFADVVTCNWGLICEFPSINLLHGGEKVWATSISQSFYRA